MDEPIYTRPETDEDRRFAEMVKSGELVLVAKVNVEIDWSDPVFPSIRQVP